MRNKSILLASILFVAINTSFLWERLPSGWDFLLTLALAILYLTLLAVLLFKLIRSITQKFKNRLDTVSIIIIATVFIFCYFFPLGLIRSSDLDPESYMIANREGVANCNTTIKLGIDKTFIERSVCFGVNRKTGTYVMRNDTVFLRFNKKSDNGASENFGVIEWSNEIEEGNYGYFNYFKSESNDKPIRLTITEIKQ